MQFIDLAAQQARIRANIEARIRAVLDHGQYIMGPEIRELEKKLAKYVGVKHGLACASGTDALLLALMAMDVGPGDAVFTSPFTFIATAEVVSLLGATSVFVDIDPDTFNIDPALLEEVVTAIRDNDRRHPVLDRLSADRHLRPKAIIPVDIFGLPADYDRIHQVAKGFKLPVIEDAAQSFGAHYKSKMACSLGDIACTSFFPAKPLGCYGDGGMCFTDNDHYMDVMTSLRIHGTGGDQYDNARIGINGRMDTLQAAILLEKFTLFPDEVRLREAVARRYGRMLSGNPRVVPPRPPDKVKSIWAQYSILAEDGEHRACIQGRLKEAGIPTAVYYPKPLHLQTAFCGLGYQKGDFPISEDYAQRIFSLPMHPYLDETDQETIVGLINEI
jgi:dTDP-4-amino-4,6-dideoxygalactose transaminase